MAQITSPAPGSSLTTTTATFAWSAGTNVTQYWLSVGTTLNGSQIWGGSTGSARSQTVSSIPIDAGTIYVRLESLRDGIWLSSYATYTGGGIAHFTSPAPGSAITTSTATFTWSPGTGVTQYWLSVGTSLNGSQLFGGGTGTVTSQTVAGIPTDGRPIYARIESYKNGSWRSSSATYNTSP